jgi:peptidoglycan LD-endopeptidase CwlK
MAADIQLLDQRFRMGVIALIQNCLSRGVEMRPNEGLRAPAQQARYWRQSRSREEINRKINELRSSGADFLSNCIEQVGPQHGPHVTNAIPGYSWHQWGEALDCFWVVDDRAVWDLKTEVNGVNGYMVYASEAKKLGMDAGYYWHSFRDAPHVQFRKEANPAAVFSLSDINRIMAERFS